MQIKNIISNGISTKNKFNQDILAKYTVKVLSGIHKDRIASVVHVYQNHIFIKDKTYQKNEGIFVTYADNCFVLDT